MTDYRVQKVDDSNDRPDFIIGDDTVSFDQLAALLLAYQDGDDIDQVVQNIKDGVIE